MADTLQREQQQRKLSDYPIENPPQDEIRSAQLDEISADAMRQSGNIEVLIPGLVTRFAEDRAGASTLRHRYRDMHADLD